MTVEDRVDDIRESCGVDIVEEGFFHYSELRCEAGGGSVAICVNGLAYTAVEVGVAGECTFVRDYSDDRLCWGIVQQLE